MLCALILPLGIAGASAGASPVARSAAGCSKLQTPDFSGGYALSTTVKGVGCGTVHGVEAGWETCRLKHGRKGVCHTKILGFTCHEKRMSSPVSIDATLACKHGRKIIDYFYVQGLV
ncbi:MAG: hypothetical protein ACR2KV_16085 [Solirubrobacteraceae bacterium]